MSNTNISETNNPNYKHGGTFKYVKEFNSWRAMKGRCQDINNDHYIYYGGRGIKICDRWKLFSNFLIDMGKREDGMTLDRINVDGHYEPSNCRWATVNQQANNKRIYKNNTSGHKGISFSVSDNKWVARISVNGKRLYVGRYENVNLALEAIEKLRSTILLQ